MNVVVSYDFEFRLIAFHVRPYKYFYKHKQKY